MVWGAQRHAAGGSNGWITGPHRGAGLFWYAPHRAGTLLQERRYESFISGSTTSLIFTCVTERKTEGFFSPLVAIMHIAWYSEDKPFAVGYADGKLLIGSKEPLDKGAIVVIDAHKVE